ncbi:DNA polymerase III subunit gamma/tau [Francisella frigiditurris]|uniref:DNA polymerase III subunit gamma/tau n=1 Tax=Francisella frigiditurris TaxID=1542390 RepID=A0A1J0KRJ4_9GAMM|nr:DNA polymerase III subunit gamma/tau [Francisella frigiditurris]APC96377.1 DNA polymerase III, subunit gamma and tau [Francisella frigiditurris]
MSYQALARKYRPKSFAEVCGQQHALNSLVHALETQKVHHAYLFTGTRGVGKTTLGRLLAKCLNCQSGVTADPCNVCESCTAINNGTFIDLIEIDAASRTGVEETKEILDNIQYMPSQGRYKVYLIDEVHMLSKQSFNALLKTLEEPPEYVKFILATTDYHKIPVTILSRCIQLHLKHISQEDIKAQLKEILQKESIDSDEQSLEYIAYHAKGSLRDALSILDQAISFCNGTLHQAKVREMLGIVDNEEIYSIIYSIINNDPQGILPAIKNLSLTESNAEAILDRISEIWFSCCLYHFTNSLDTTNDVSLEVIKDILGKISVEEVHLLYQLTISSKEDIHLAPNFETGVTMALLRLIAFQKKNLTESETTNILKKTIVEPNIQQQINPPSEKVNSPKQQKTSEQNDENHSDINNDQKWFSILNKIKLKGFTKTFAFNTHLISLDKEEIRISLNEDAKKILELNPNSLEKLQESIRTHSENENIKIIMDNHSQNSKNAKKTPSEIKRENAVNKVFNDTNVKIIKETLDLEIQDQNIVLTN